MRSGNKRQVLPLESLAEPTGYNLMRKRFTRDIPRLTSLMWQLGDLSISARLWLLDRIAGPYPETEADRIRERRKERLRRAFPDVDIDGAGRQRRR